MIRACDMHLDSPATMTVRKKYVLGDFTKYGTGKLVTKFATISNMALYEFSEKLYLDGKNRAHQCHMLLVGHYSRKSGGPQVWAYATGENICYYSGAGTQVTPLVQDIHSSKVYYDPPFSYIGGSLDYNCLKSGMNPERKLERTIVDSAINFMFFMSGRLEQVLDLVNPDILDNFRQACANLVRHQKPLHVTGHALNVQYSEGEASVSGANGHLHPNNRIAAIEPSARLAHYNKDPASANLRKRQIVDISDDPTSDHSRRKYSVCTYLILS